ncbi:stage II sporulation protein P [Clostridioides difficile]
MQWVNGNNKVKKKKNHISIGYIVLLVLMIIFVIRAVSVINSYRERGGLAYVQLLNFSMPVVETQIYDSTAYRENKVSIKRVVAEALGLNNITSYGIIGNEVSFFSDITKINNNNANKVKATFNLFEPYVVKEDSIARVTEEDLAELNKTSAAYDPSLKKTLDNANVEILIYHTHTHEGYAEAGSDTDQEDFSVVGVGDVLAEELEKGYGIAVVHDKTIHDTSPYDQSYYRSEPTVQSYLNQFPNLKLVIDLHRNSGPSKDRTTAEINGQSLARFMFVTSKASPYYTEMMETVNEMISTSESLFPGLLADGNSGTGLYEYDRGSNNFNQDLSPACILTEFGTDLNTAQEAKLSAKYLARLIAEHLNR